MDAWDRDAPDSIVRDADPQMLRELVTTPVPRPCWRRNGLGLWADTFVFGASRSFSAKPHFGSNNHNATAAKVDDRYIPQGQRNRVPIKGKAMLSFLAIDRGFTTSRLRKNARLANELRIAAGIKVAGSPQEMRRDFLGGATILPRNEATRVCVMSLCLLAPMLRGEAPAQELTGVPRSDDPRDQAPNASQPSTRLVTRTNTTTATDLPPLPDIDSDQPSQKPGGTAQPSARRIVPGVSPNEVQRALDAGAGAGGVSLPRSAENAASQVQLQQGPSNREC